MSGLFSSIGKIFKKVVPVLKKIALPALAIAAVVVTGGAALGLLPGIAGLGGLAASLGASPLIAGVLSAAGTGATVGMIGGLLTTGSISGAIKGASMGLLTGAAAGGISGALGGLGGGIPAPDLNAAAPLDLAPVSAATTLPGGLGAASTASAADVASNLAGQAASGIGGAMAQAGGGLVEASGGGGGILGFLNRNPLLASGLMKGIGSALQQRSQMKYLDQRRKSYNVDNVYQPYDVGELGDLQGAGERYNTIINGQGRYEYDPVTGRILPARSG